MKIKNINFEKNFKKLTTKEQKKIDQFLKAIDLKLSFPICTSNNTDWEVKKTKLYIYCLAANIDLIIDVGSNTIKLDQYSLIYNV